MTTTSYWLEEPADAFPARAMRGRVEAAVIGGGVTGCSCALTLARHGVSVRVYEARTIAGGASGRQGGFAPPGAGGAGRPAPGRPRPPTARARPGPPGTAAR